MNSSGDSPSSANLRVPLASSGLEEEDIDAVVATLRSNALTMGARVREFEEEMATYLGAEHFVMMNSGSSANLAIIESLLRPTRGEPRLMPGDGVLLPAIAWPTTVWPVVQLGLEPIFVDIDPETIMIDLHAAEYAIRNSRTQIRALFPIHPLGHAIDPHALQEFSARHNLVLISDVCEALGSWRGGLHAGMGSLAASFSFYFSHHITTMEGGGVATNDLALADDLRSIRSHGWSRDRSDAKQWAGVTNDVNSRFLFVSAGYNIRPMEIQAALGIGQIRRIDSYIERRRHIASCVAEALRGSGLRLLCSDTLELDRKSHSWMLLPIRAKSKELAQSTLVALHNAGVETRPILTGNFTAQPSLSRILKSKINPRDFTQADFVSESSFMVGCHHHFTDEQVQFLAESLKYAGAS
ncbi:MAG: DegT/DnrJ/EryC1/StrS family aminotransferase [Ilumatobacteraceae bacterium]